MNAIKHNPAAFAVVGIAAAFVFAVCWILAAQSDPSWVLGTDTISKLGVSDVQLTADLFKYGCFITGALAVVFGAGKAYCETKANRASGISLIIAGVFLILVGEFNMDYGNGFTHDCAAWSFFFFLYLAMILSACGNAQDGKRLPAAFAAILVVVPLALFVGKDIAFVEAVAVAMGLLWLISESAKMITEIRASKSSGPIAI